MVQEVAGEVRKNEEAARLAAQSPSEKKQRDEDTWRAWLGRYQQRLQHELAGQCLVLSDLVHCSI